MVIAALAADGISEIYGLSHIDRGYEKMEDAVRLLGGDMQRS